MEDLLFKRQDLAGYQGRNVALDKKSLRHVASRFNVIVTTEDGHLVLYNSFTGAIGAIPTEKLIQETVLNTFRYGLEGEPEGILEDLKEGGFLIAEGTNEFVRATYLHESGRYATDVLALILMPTEECNFRCVYCYEDFKHKKMRPEVQQGVKLFVQKRAPTLSRLEVGWFGGEPLEALDVIQELSHSFIDTSREHGFTYKANITTNGYNLTLDVARTLLDLQVRRFQVTLDGPSEEHDRRRKLMSGGPTFERILKNLQDLRRISEDYHISIRVNFDRENLRKIPDFLGFLKDQFGDDPRFSVYFRPVGQWGGPNDAKLPVCDGTTGERAMYDLFDMAVHEGLKVIDPLHKHLQPHGSVCYAALPYSFVIRADGRVCKCTVALESDPNIIGKIKPDGELALNLDKFALWVSLDETVDEGCQKCFFRPACQGSACPWKRIKYGARPCPPDKNNIKRLLSIIWLGKEQLQTNVQAEAKEGACSM